MENSTPGGPTNHHQSARALAGRTDLELRGRPLRISPHHGGLDGCTSFVDLWAEHLTRDTGRPVEVTNDAVPNAEAHDVLDQLKKDNATRSAVKDADLIVIAVGINDSPWNRLDDPCDAAPDYPVIRWSKITAGCIERVAADYKLTLDAILTEVDELRAGEPTALRLTNVYNAVIGDHVDPSWDSPDAVAPSKTANDLLAQIQCDLVERHGGDCIDVYSAFNGSDGSKPARQLLASDHTHPSPKGHKVIAQLLAQSGREPLP
jgi:lysophospholipase L1-like esterase